jgi:chaperonin GroES
MTQGAGSGDKLASGAPSAQFSGPQVSNEKWKEAFPGSETLEERRHRLALAEGATEEQYQQARKIVEELKAEVKPPTVDYDFRPVQDRLIVRRVEVEEKVGTFFVPDESKEKPYEGDVLAVGPGKYVGSEFVKPTIVVGERVVFGKFSGAEVKVGLETLLILREEDIFFIKVKKVKAND